ncbi:Predicted transmembrane transcriptional regulator (anti-sigma factor) [Mycobacterium tuberculosis]|nr:Predicted transmembrane transcriptional regulator (anti-sigma factor) [Mycobacterium tuberculosis]
MSCLGERLTALVDGELGHEERDRVLAHLAGCAQCRAEVAGLRRVKGRLRGLSGLPAADGTDELPTPDFLNRLRSLPAAAAEPPPPAGPPPGGTPSHRPARPLRSSARPVRPAAAGRPRDNRPAGHAAVQAHPHPRRRVLAVGAATLVLGLGTASYIAGGSKDAPTVTPAFDRFAVEHALTSGDAPMTDPLTDPVYQVQVSPGP